MGNACSDPDQGASAQTVAVKPKNGDVKFNSLTETKKTETKKVSELNDKGALKRLYPEHEIATIATDRNAKIIYANPVCYRYLGYLANELVGHPIEILFPEKFKKFHAERREAYVKRQGEGRLWIPSDIMDRARLESVLTKDGELQQVLITLTDMGRQDNENDVQFFLTLKPHYGKRTAS